MSDDTLDIEKWKKVLAYLGDELAGHVLASCDPLGDTALTPPQTEVAKLLVQAFSGSQLGAWNALRRWDDIAGVLCRYDNGLDGSLAAYMHYVSGGRRPNSTPGDDLEGALCQWAVDVYPLFLIGGIGDDAQHHMFGLLYGHPLRSAALTAMFRPDEPLMALFPQAAFEGIDPTELHVLSSYVTWTNASGGTVQFSGIPQSILLRSTGAPQPGKSTLAAYLDSVRETLATARSLAEGKTTRVTATVGCYSMSLAEDVPEIRLADGRFRRKTPMDHALIQERQAETVVLEIQMDLQRAEAPLTDLSSWSGDNMSAERLQMGEEFQQLLQDRIDRARMAVLLSSGNYEVLTVGQASVSLPIPVTLSGGYSSSPLAWPVAPFQTQSRPLTANDAEHIGEWDGLLEEFPQGMRIGCQRLLAAVNERSSPFDGFIDAVIAWENLFGTNQETTFRVCAAIAWLLEPMDAGLRTSLFKEASDLYGARSNLVHGAVLSPKHQITPSKAQWYRDRSVHIAMDAFRAVLRSDELRQASESSVRGKMLLLNGAMGGPLGGSGFA